MNECILTMCWYPPRSTQCILLTIENRVAFDRKLSVSYVEDLGSRYIPQSPSERLKIRSSLRDDEARRRVTSSNRFRWSSGGWLDIQYKIRRFERSELDLRYTHLNSSCSTSCLARRKRDSTSCLARRNTSDSAGSLCAFYVIALRERNIVRVAM